MSRKSWLWKRLCEPLVVGAAQVEDAEQSCRVQAAAPSSRRATMIRGSAQFLEVGEGMGTDDEVLSLSVVKCSQNRDEMRIHPAVFPSVLMPAW